MNTYTVKFALTGTASDVLGNQVDVIVNADNQIEAELLATRDTLKVLSQYNANSSNSTFSVYAVFVD